MPPNSYIRFDVGEGEVGLLFYNGVFQKPLKAGVYYFWNYHIKVTVQTVDTRVQQLEVSGQEILTADKVSLCVNFVCSYSIVDPISVVVRLKDYQNQIHVLVQIMLREFAGKYRFDELLQQKDSIGGFVLEKLREREGELFIRFSDAGVKDMVFPGEIRDIMNTVLIAENSTLLKLKELEYLERICEKIGSISVDAGGSILSGLRELVAEI